MVQRIFGEKMSNIPGISVDQYSQLDIEKFSHVLDDPNECYKFYWLEAIIQLLSKNNLIIPFDDIFDQMIANAWYTVTTFHLKLGPRRDINKPSNAIEKAVYSLNNAVELPQNATRMEVLDAIEKYRKAVMPYEKVLAINVPYRLLSSFITVTGNSKDWYKPDRMIDHFHTANNKQPLPYIIENTENGEKQIVIHPNWADLLRKEAPILLGWIQYQKVLFLQNRNPNVPGIVYKLVPEDVKERKLGKVTKLWNALTEQEEVRDIYCGKILSKGNYDIDHFVPWSYIANDELWNLLPMDSSLNSSKSNKLPDWQKYSEMFFERQYFMYTQIHEKDSIRDLFNKCIKDNLNAQWALDELYLPENSEEMFKNILSANLKPIYDSARLQGFRIWM